ncbi:MAG: SEL1-like repeat protein [Alphaproteobacteria bacterium]|jgi:TPR repeat protein|nr:SEL1-like repeat protein [Alphaproteobacteria bacterium]
MISAFVILRLAAILAMLAFVLAMPEPSAIAADPDAADLAATGEPDAFFAGLDAWRAGDLKAAHSHWNKAAAAGDADAQYNLATLYQSGLGIDADPDAAATLYAEAARRLVPVAAVALTRIKRAGYGVDIRAQDALDYLQGAASRGSALAQFELAIAYDRGIGVTQNHASAALWYQRAARQGMREAQYNLGVLFDEGLGAPRDHEAAREWYMKAAERGSAAAQNNIGYLHEKGFGVPQDMAEAARWYRKAADAGLAVAQNNLGIMYHYGYGVPRDLKTAITWYRSAANGGDPGAQNSLGLVLANGLGMPRDPVEAMSWFILAGDAPGDIGDQARANRDRFSAKLPSEQLAEARRSAELRQAKINAPDTGSGGWPAPRPLAPKNMGDPMIAAQRYLRILGLYDAKVDGIPGGMTSEAVATFERQHGLNVSGLVTPELIRALRTATGR